MPQIVDSAQPQLSDAHIFELRASYRVRETLEASAPMDLSSIGPPPWVQVRAAPGCWCGGSGDT